MKKLILILVLLTSFSAAFSQTSLLGRQNLIDLQNIRSKTLAVDTLSAKIVKNITTVQIPDATDKRYITDAQRVTVAGLNTAIVNPATAPALTPSLAPIVTDSSNRLSTTAITSQKIATAVNALDTLIIDSTKSVDGITTANLINSHTIKFKTFVDGNGYQVVNIGDTAIGLILSATTPTTVTDPASLSAPINTFAGRMGIGGFSDAAYQFGVNSTLSTLAKFSSTVSTGWDMRFERGSPNPVLSGDKIGQFAFQTKAQNHFNGFMGYWASEDGHIDTAEGTEFRLGTTRNGEVSAHTSLLITGDSKLVLGNGITALHAVSPSVKVDFSDATVDAAGNVGGILVPKVTRAKRIAIPSPADGILVYQTDQVDKGFWYYDLTALAWKQVGQGSSAATTGYTLEAHSSNFNPTVNANFYIGSVSVVTSSPGVSRIYVPQTGIITKVFLYCNVGTGTTGSSTETGSFNIQVNGATVTGGLIASSNFGSAISTAVSNSNMSVSVNAGDYVEIRLGMPTTWATLPTQVRISAVIYVQQ